MLQVKNNKANKWNAHKAKGCSKNNEHDENSNSRSKVEEKKDAAVADFEEVKNSIRNQLLQQRQNKVYSDKVKELREKYVQE